MRVALGFLCLLLLPALAGAQTERVDQYMKAALEQRRIPGAALLVMQRGEIVRMQGYGLANVELDVPVTPDTVFEEIRKTVPAYNVPAPLILAGGAAQANPVNGRIAVLERPDPIHSAHDNLFTSGNLGRYSKVLHQVMEGCG